MAGSTSLCASVSREGLVGSPTDFWLLLVSAQGMLLSKVGAQSSSLWDCGECTLLAANNIHMVCCRITVLHKLTATDDSKLDGTQANVAMSKPTNYRAIDKA